MKIQDMRGIGPAVSRKYSSRRPSAVDERVRASQKAAGFFFEACAKHTAWARSVPSRDRRRANSRFFTLFVANSKLCCEHCRSPKQRRALPRGKLPGL
jgi:hypothetical protein